MCALVTACPGAPDPNDDSLAVWSPPDNFTQHEKDALMRHCPIVNLAKRISVQGFDVVGYKAGRKYDSSTAWVSANPPFLCRTLSFFEVAPCCNLDCEEELMVEVKRFTTRRDVTVPGNLTCQMAVNQPIEYISAASLMAQTVILFPKIETTPRTQAERQNAQRTLVYGPFIVVNVKRKVYQ